MHVRYAVSMARGRALIGEAVVDSLCINNNSQEWPKPESSPKVYVVHVSKRGALIRATRPRFNLKIQQ